MEEGEAVILAEGLYSTTDGKTAHGLVRKSLRYKIVGVIDSTLAGRDAGEVLDGKPRGIKIYSSLEEALKEHPGVKFLIIGVATPGGRLPPSYREVVKEALKRGISVVSGLHEFLSDDPELSRIARETGAEIIDVRKIYYNTRKFYTGKIKEVKALKVVVIGTDSAVGKRTVAHMVTDELNARGIKAVFVGTGQTAWMQGAKYVFVLDSVINDFVPGVLEDVVWRAYSEEKPKVIVVPGQGSLLHPVFPGSYEILNLLKPEVTILHHAPGRKHLDGFPEYPVPPLEKFLKLVEIITDRRVFAITLSTEGLSEREVLAEREKLEKELGIPVVVPMIEGVGRIVDEITRRFPEVVG
ncbi:DUF1611 domain-containing protein [Thermofilum pendens]|uniref:DUF1611 domain-containing protein n=1 Tax=Thermofilum pendens (strain DSM 2475 / Hrk 5) TaxID=368408 RepID=A1S0F4_THEPD|nr:DUF1611 domain-containing protein [Thermofilum pendens]ABL78934.1 protein of unknown function DUF1611 [Thermofilum pendens Hrk 5]